VAASRFALLCQCSPPATTAIAHPRSGLYCRLSTGLFLFFSMSPLPGEEDPGGCRLRSGLLLGVRRREGCLRFPSLLLAAPAPFIS
jgi:hypothetical protein